MIDRGAEAVARSPAVKRQRYFALDQPIFRPRSSTRPVYSSSCSPIMVLKESPSMISITLLVLAMNSLKASESAASEKMRYSSSTTSSGVEAGTPRPRQVPRTAS